MSTPAAPAAEAKAPFLPEISIETIAETMIAMVALQAAAKKCNASGLLALARVAQAISAKDGDYSIRVGQRDVKNDAAVVEAMIQIVDLAKDYPKTKADKLKAKLRGLPDKIWMLSPRRKAYVIVGELRHITQHIGMSAEDLMTFLDTYCGDPPADASSTSSPAAASASAAPRVNRKAKSDVKPKPNTAVKTGGKPKGQKKKNQN